MTEQILRDNYNVNEAGEVFDRTFQLISEHVGADAFRRYDRARDKFVGPFLVSAFEGVALGVAYNLDAIRAAVSFDWVGRIKALWEGEAFQLGAGSGRPASQRLPQTIPFGRQTFAP